MTPPPLAWGSMQGSYLGGGNIVSSQDIMSSPAIETSSLELPPTLPWPLLSINLSEWISGCFILCVTS